MIILAIDTAGEIGSLALRQDGTLIAERRLHSPGGVAQILFGELDNLLKAAGVRLSDVDLFSAANGPGSFTGVRVGVAAIKGLAEAEGKPAIAVSNLRAMSVFGSLPHRAILLDAHRGEVYAAVYGSRFEPISPEVVAKAMTWLESLTVPVDEIISFGNLDPPVFRSAKLTVAPRELAGAVAICAELDWLAGKSTDAITLDANYVRRPDAAVSSAQQRPAVDDPKLSH